jgi:predicted phosphohydrolase
MSALNRLELSSFEFVPASTTTASTWMQCAEADRTFPTSAPTPTSLSLRRPLGSPRGFRKKTWNLPLFHSSSRDPSMKPKPKSSRTRTGRATLRLVLLSDTHELHRAIEVPDGNILIHAGGFTMFSESMEEVADFNKWLGELPHRYKIVVPGNHEFFLEADPSDCFMLDNALVLINEGTEIEGLRIWGSPVTPMYGGAFGLSSAKDRKRLYAQIPQNIDVLISHGPPYGILDSDPVSGLHQGCHELLDAVMRVRPKLHVFGHIHGAYGVFQTEHTTFVNAARLGLHRDSDGAPFVFEMTRT